MPAKIGLVAQSYLEGVALPQHGSTYTVISHKFMVSLLKKNPTEQLVMELLLLVCIS
jgi:hypothetical protein